MKAIYMYEISADDYMPAVAMPQGAEILHIGAQGEKICCWALVDINPTAPSEMRVFHVIGTGHKINYNPGTYLATVMLAGGALVFHIFDANMLRAEDL